MKSVPSTRTSVLILAGSIAALFGLAPVTRATSATWLDTGGTNEGIGVRFLLSTLRRADRGVLNAEWERVKHEMWIAGPVRVSIVRTDPFHDPQRYLRPSGHPIHKFFNIESCYRCPSDGGFLRRFGE